VFAHSAAHRRGVTAVDRGAQDMLQRLSDSEQELGPACGEDIRVHSLRLGDSAGWWVGESNGLGSSSTALKGMCVGTVDVSRACDISRHDGTTEDVAVCKRLAKLGVRGIR
jgi:hypothetical protein